MADRVWDVASKISIGAVMALGGIIWGLEARVTKIETRLDESMFTKEDAANFERRLFKELDPEWLRNGIVDIKDAVREVDSRVRRIEEKVDK